MIIKYVELSEYEFSLKIVSNIWKNISSRNFLKSVLLDSVQRYYASQ